METIVKGVKLNEPDMYTCIRYCTFVCDMYCSHCPNVTET